MRKLIITMTVVMAFCLTTNSALAGDANDTDAAACAITASVDQIVEWEGPNIPAIGIAAITSQAAVPDSNEVFTLWVNCNVNLTADNTETVARLAHASTGDYLVTKYKISTDQAGTEGTGTGATTGAVDASSSDEWTVHSDFLKAEVTAPLAITHIDNDGAVEVTLYVQASNDMTGQKEVADAGNYACTQTITATWTSD